MGVSTQAITILDEGVEAPDIIPKHFLMCSDNTIPGWHVSDNNIGERTFIVDEERFTSIAPQIQFEGSQALVMNEGTSISTKVSLVAGQTYHFSIWGYQGPQVFENALQVAIGTFNTSLTFDSWKISGVHERTFDFVANESGEVDLIITNPETGTDYRQRAIDLITITTDETTGPLASVPDGGATAILLGLGCLGLFAMRRK
jgi:hypothetical protein